MSISPVILWIDGGCQEQHEGFLSFVKLKQFVRHPLCIRMIKLSEVMKCQNYLQLIYHVNSFFVFVHMHYDSVFNYLTASFFSWILIHWVHGWYLVDEGWFTEQTLYYLLWKSINMQWRTRTAWGYVKSCGQGSWMLWRIGFLLIFSP